MIVVFYRIVNLPERIIVNHSNKGGATVHPSPVWS